MSNKKHHEQHEEDGEGWLISYADLMTLMFGFFVLMYKAVSDDGRVKDLEQKIGASLVGFDRPIMEDVIDPASEDRQARAFQILVNMLDLDPNTAVGTIEKKFSSQAEAEALKKVFSEKLGEKGAQELAMKSDDSLRILIPADTGFKSGEAVLLPQSLPKLQEIARSLQKVQDLMRIEVIGHTDDQAPRSGGRWTSNWELSSARAASVGLFLQQSGVPASKIRISGAADNDPLVALKNLDATQLTDARRQNRRIEIAIYRESPKEPNP